MAFDLYAASFLNLVVEGVFYGAYCVVFAIYLRLQLQRSPDGRRNPLTYVLSTLFLLCTIYFVITVIQAFVGVFDDNASPGFSEDISIAGSVLFACVDMLSQGVLIYRCWKMSAGKLSLVIIPALMSLASFACAITSIGEIPHTSIPVKFNFALGLASFILSLAVNTIVTGLLVLRLVLIHREFVQGVNRKQRTDLRPLIAMLMESGMFTFIAQLTWVVLYPLQTTSLGYVVVNGAILMTYGITPTIVIVRVSMNASYENTTTQTVEDTVHFTRSDRHHASDAGQRINHLFSIAGEGEA